MSFILPLLVAPIVIIVQLLVWEYLTPEVMDIEVSLLLVIYAGLKGDIIHGGLLSFVLGYFLDILAGSAQGLHTFLYMFVFLFSRASSKAVNVNTAPITMGFVLIMALIKWFLFLGYLDWKGGIDWWNELSSVLLPQALILALLSPYLFGLLDRYNIVSTYERQQR